MHVLAFTHGLFAALAELLDSSPVLAGLALAAVVSVALAVLTVKRRRYRRWSGEVAALRRAVADEQADRARAARIADDDRLHGWPVSTNLDDPDRTMPVPRALVVDPVLEALAADVVEHVRPGVGSLVGLADAVADTFECRTPAEQRHLMAVWDEAQEEREARTFVDMFADFDDAMHAALTDFAVGTRAVDRLDHDPNGCPCCWAAVQEVSDEYALLVQRALDTPTGQYSLAQLEAMLSSS